MAETKEEVENETQTEPSSDVDNLTLDSIVIHENGDVSNDNNLQEPDIVDTEKTSDDPSDSDQETSDPKNEETTEDDGTSTDSPAETTAAPESDQQQINDDEEVYTQISEETGIDVASDDDVINSLKELSDFRKNKDSAPELSKAIRQAIEVEKSGGNLAVHFTRTGMDFDKMDAKEVLRQNFFKKEAKLHASNPEFAQMKFERQFTDSYGKWLDYEKLTSQEDKDDFVEESGQKNIDYEKMMFENDVSNAKEELNAWKEEATPVAQPQNGGMTEDEATEFAEKYQERAKVALSNFEAVSIEMGEGLDDFSLGLNDKTSPLVKQWAASPADFLAAIGFEGKEIDVERLLPVMTLIAEADNGTLGGRIAKFATDSETLDTIKNKVDKPTSSTSPAVPQDRGSGDVWEQIGEAAVIAKEKFERR